MQHIYCWNLTFLLHENQKKMKMKIVELIETLLIYEFNSFNAVRNHTLFSFNKICYSHTIEMHEIKQYCIPALLNKSRVHRGIHYRLVNMTTEYCVD